MVTASLTFRIQPHKRAEVLSAVDALHDRMRGVAGCERSRLLVDADDPSAFVLASEWRDSAAASDFFESRVFRAFRGIRILLRGEPLIVLDDVKGRITRLLRSAEG